MDLSLNATLDKIVMGSATDLKCKLSRRTVTAPPARGCRGQGSDLPLQEPQHARQLRQGLGLRGQDIGQLIRLNFQGNHKMVSKNVPLDEPAFSYEFSQQTAGKYITTACYRLTDRTSNVGNKSTARTLGVR